MEIKKIFAVPHFHFDVEWWKTYDGYARDAARIILEALRLLEERPDFEYTLDQALAIKPFLDAHPEKYEELLKYIKEGRIELVGGTLAAPDENLPTGESLVRQFVYGKKFFRERFGVDCVTGWMIDEFGHSAQLPQILRKCGFKYLAFARGMRWYERHPIDFLWEGLDGSKILTHWLCTNYIGLIPFGLTKGWRIRGYEAELKTDLLWEGRLSPTENLLFTFGGDFTVPQKEWVEFVDRWNASNEPKIVFATPKEFFSELETRDLPTAKGEFNPIFAGCYESREKVKKLCREVQNRILAAEKLASLALFFGGRYPSFDGAWELILTNDSHDVICGTGTDRVYRNALMRYAAALAKIGEAERHAIRTLTSRIKTDEIDGIPLVVFNTLAWPRKGVVEVDGEFRVFEPSGKEIPSQVANGKTIFLAQVPSLGYSTYYLVEGECGKEETALRFSESFLENEYLRVETDAHGIKSVFAKEAGKEILAEDGLANELVVEEDVGNLWTVCKTGRVFRDEYPTRVELIERGPVRATIEIQGRHHRMDRIQRISLYSGLPGIFFKTFVDFRGKDRRVKVVFPTRIRGPATYEVPYAALERPDGHWPAQNWVDISDGELGVAILNRGNPSHEVHDGIMSMTLFRSISVASPGLVLHVLKKLRSIMKTLGQAAKMLLDGHRHIEEYLMDHHYLVLREFASGGGGFELEGGVTIPDHVLPYLTPFRVSDAWERGEHEFEYAVYPHRGNWADANLPRVGHEFNTPLLAVKTSRHDGELPSKFSFVEVSGANAILAAMKRAEDGEGLVVRVYEAHGKGSIATLKFFKLIKSARRVSLTEDEVFEELTPEGDRVTFGLGKWEIATLKFEF